MKTFCFALDLNNDPALIAEYRRFHEPGTIWPEVVAEILCPEVISEQIYLLGSRMVMVLNTTDEFSLEANATRLDQSHTMRRWEQAMDPYQKRLPQAKSGEKWVQMEKIFEV